MRYCEITEEILNEFGREQIDPEKISQIVKNPSAKTVLRMYKKAEDDFRIGSVLRGLITDDGTLYFWDAMLMTHSGVTMALNLPYDTGRLYVYNIMSDPVLVFTDHYTVLDFPAFLKSEELCVEMGSHGIVTFHEAANIILAMRD